MRQSRFVETLEGIDIVPPPMDDAEDARGLSMALDRSSARTIDENGFMRVRDCPISKETVNPYRGDEIPDWQALGLDSERIYQVYRPGDELAAGADSFGGLPLDLDHHEESAETPQKEHRVGSVGTDVHFDGTYLRATLTVTDAKAIQAIESGEAREISCAYAFDPVVRAGDFKGQSYDIVMTRIRGNHVALVDKGRAGPDVRVQDSATIPDCRKGENPVSRKMNTKRKVVRQLAGDSGADLAKAFEGAIEEGRETDKPAGEIVAEMVQEAKAEVASDPSPDDPVTDDQELDVLLEGVDPEKATAIREYVARVRANDEPGVMDETVTEEDEKTRVASDRRGGRKRTPVLDADTIRRQARDEAVGHMRALTDAGRLVEPITGRIDALTYDSADKIYAYALDAAGVDRRGEPASAYRGMVKTLLASRTDHPLDHQFSSAPMAQGGAFSGAQDSAIEGADSPFRFLNAIR